MSGIIDGKKIAEEILENLKQKIDQIKKDSHLVPGLATLMIGNDPASLSFIKIKEQTAQKVGIYFEKKFFPENFALAKILDFIRAKNADKRIQGIIVQLPLPSHLNQIQILKAIHPFKDADCLHPKNIGLLFYGQPTFLSPIIKTVKKILEVSLPNFNDLKGKKVVLVGSGVLIGRSLSLWLISQGASFTLCRSSTPNLIDELKKADLIISGTGVPHLIKARMVKKGAIVIDFGFGKLNDKIVGDVNFEEIAKKAYVTPTPGGTGPITVAYLMENVVFPRGLEPPVFGSGTQGFIR